MLGEYPYSGDYIFRNILNRGPFAAEKTMSGYLGAYADDAAKMDEIVVMIGQLEAKSQQLTQLVDSTEPGISSDVSLWNILRLSGGETAQKYMNMRDASNALYEKGKAVIDNWTSYIKATDVITAGPLDSYYNQFKEIVAEYDKFLGVVAEASQERREDLKPTNLLDDVKGLLIMGLVGYAAIKFGPDIIKMFKK